MTVLRIRRAMVSLVASLIVAFVTLGNLILLDDIAGGRLRSCCAPTANDGLFLLLGSIVGTLLVSGLAARRTRAAAPSTRIGLLMLAVAYAVAMRLIF